MTPCHAPALLIALLLAAPASAAPDEEAAIEERRQSLVDIERQMRVLEEDLGERRAGRESLLEELAQHERDIADLARAGRQLAAMITEQERALAEIQAKLAAQREELARRRAALAGLLRSVHAMGRGERIRLLLDQDDLSRVSRVIAYYGYLNRNQLARIGAVAAAARRLEGLAAEAAEETRRLAHLAGRQDQTQRDLEAAQAERGALLAELEQVIAGTEERVLVLRADAEGLRALVEQLERQARALPEEQIGQAPIAGRRGGLRWPVEGGRVLARFDTPKREGEGRWDGLLIGAPEGTEVRAVHPGRVVYADWLRGFGLLLIIEHDEGYMTLYGHNQTLLKEPGEWVSEGDPIALSGSSGGRRAPGLYFAIRHRGRPLDPQRWCRAGGGQSSRSGFGTRLRPTEHAAVFPIQSAAPLVALAAPSSARTTNIR